ncbi:MAG: rhodanese-like domain-containing protein [Candidatus Rifleibacteriota bacterium]
MIETFFAADLLNSSQALFSAFILGIAFGWCLEQAGFGSSKRLTGIFYFRDMSVLKVMFSAVITAMLGLLLLSRVGLVKPDSIFLPETIFGAQIIGGLLFGFGFAVGGWCPGTAAVGAVSGKFDAIVFLLGAMIGSMAFSESFAWIESYYNLGASGIRFVFSELGMSAGQFALAMTGVAVLAFWISELIEVRFDFSKVAEKAQGLWIFSMTALIVATAVSAMPARSVSAGGNTGQKEIMTAIYAARDHIAPVDLAREMVAGQKKIVCVDVRSSDEYHEWHIPGARNFPPESIIAGLERYRKHDRIVLYSNGMVHPAQIWVLLKLNGFDNATVLSEGLSGFREDVLKPVALRIEPLSVEQKNEIEKWRSFFLTSANAVGAN